MPSLTGNDTLVIAGINIVDVCDGDWFMYNFENDLANAKRGKNGNTIFAENAMGLVANSSLRLLRGSENDKQLNTLMQTQFDDFSAFVLLDGQFVKRVGDGQGNITSDTGRMSGGIFKRAVDAKSNAEGDTDQSVSVYNFLWAEIDRAIF